MAIYILSYLFPLCKNNSFINRMIAKLNFLLEFLMKDFPLAVLCENYCVLLLTFEFSSYSAPEFWVKAANPPISSALFWYKVCVMWGLVLPTS